VEGSLSRKGEGDLQKISTLCIILVRGKDLGGPGLRYNLALRPLGGTQERRKATVSQTEVLKKGKKRKQFEEKEKAVGGSEGRGTRRMTVLRTDENRVLRGGGKNHQKRTQAPCPDMPPPWEIRRERGVYLRDSSYQGEVGGGFELPGLLVGPCMEGRDGKGDWSLLYFAGAGGAEDA